MRQNDAAKTYVTHPIFTQYKLSKWFNSALLSNLLGLFTRSKIIFMISLGLKMGVKIKKCVFCFVCLVKIAHGWSETPWCIHIMVLNKPKNISWSLLVRTHLEVQGYEGYPNDQWHIYFYESLHKSGTVVYFENSKCIFQPNK